ncbi:MAG: hypothetical protein O3A37_04030, partial [Planctomycetota bacterium]|nr:hypothetical protein [Planctomycetota bacterium]
ARAPSPDVRYGHRALRSLSAGYAPPSMAPLAAKAGSRGTGSPSRFLRYGTHYLRGGDGAAGKAARVANRTIACLEGRRFWPQRPVVAKGLSQWGAWMPPLA